MDNLVISFLSGCLGGVLIIWCFFNFFVERVDEQEDQPTTFPDDWVFPLKLRHTNTIWYAWDLDGNFILQAKSKDALITEILNKYDIPPKRLAIESESELNEDDQTPKA